MDIPPPPRLSPFDENDIHHTDESDSVNVVESDADRHYDTSMAKAIEYLRLRMKFRQQALYYWVRIVSFIFPPQSERLQMLHFFGSFLACLFFAGVICGFARQLRYVDALFNVVSAYTGTGLIATDITVWRLPEQITLLLAMLVGSSYLEALFLNYMKLRSNQRLCKEADSNVEVDLELSRRLKSERDASHLLVQINAICFIVAMIVPTVFIGTYLQLKSERSDTDDSTSGNNPYWWALFHVITAFTNAGYSLEKDQFVTYSNDYVVLITYSIVLSVGTSMAPLMIRCVLYLYLAVARTPERKELLRHLLQGGHKQHRLLWAKTETTVIIIYSSILMLVSFAIITAREWDSLSLARQKGPAEKVLAIWFTISSARFAGLNCVDMTELDLSSMLVLMFIMYLPKSPVEDSITDECENVGLFHYWRTNSRRLITRWTPFLFCAMLAIVLSNEFNDGFNFLNVMFEVSSAFGTCGYSLVVDQAGVVSLSPQSPSSIDKKGYGLGFDD